jgi:hypothetical protein
MDLDMTVGDIIILGGFCICSILISFFPESSYYFAVLLYSYYQLLLQKV